MIITRTPFRISFAGGGSDFEDFYRKRYGAVVSTTINKYMYIIVHPYFHEKIRIKYSRTEDVDNIDDIKHPLVRESLRLAKIKKGMEIASIADVPAGTGIGSSSAFTVGLVHALHAYLGRPVTKERLSEDACRIEIDILEEPIGRQDQYAVSYGGLNYIKFCPDGKITVEPILMDGKTLKRLEKNLLMFYVGHARDAGRILSEQKRNLKQVQKYRIVEKMVGLAEETKESLEKGDLQKFGDILHRGWLLKRQMASGISSGLLDKHYARALNNGAAGGKLLGAGGGGFLLFYCEPREQSRLRSALKLREMEFAFDRDGSKLLLAEQGR